MKRLACLFSCVIAGLPCLCDAVPVHAYIVCGEGGRPMAATPLAVSNYVNRLNFVFSQVAVDFELVRCGVLTNENWLTICSTNSAQYEALCATTNSTGGIEMYFVEDIDDCSAFKTPSGLVVSQDANWRTVAHEVGHLCGMRDIYDESDETDLRVRGRSTRERMPDDFGRPSSSVPHADRIKKLLMYGYFGDEKFDISYGDIYGLGRRFRYNQSTGNVDVTWDLFNVEVGFWRHGTRTPACN